MDGLPDIDSLALGFNPPNVPGQSVGQSENGALVYSVVGLSKATDQSSRARNSTFSAASYFPWNESFWDESPVRHTIPPNLLITWRNTVAQWRNVVALCGDSKVLVFRTTSGQPISPRWQKSISREDRLRTIAWAIDPRTLHPLLLFAGDRALIHIWDVISRSSKGILRGHGGPIKELTTHPSNPFIFASTSRDRSVRIYDLTLDAISNLRETYWPNSSLNPRPAEVQIRRPGPRGKHRGASSQGEVVRTVALSVGAPLGSGIPDDEGTGIGKCVVILRGEVTGSGGHAASVLSAAFHMNGPFIATAGVDHSVKIWRLPPAVITGAFRELCIEDNPVFSSSAAHESRVTSIYWLSSDVLVSKSSGPEASIAVWKWLELDRFSPKDPTSVVKKSMTDYEDSRSFTILSKTSARFSSSDSFKLAVYQSPQSGPNTSTPTPSILMALPALESNIVILDVAQIPPVPQPDLPTYTPDFDQQETPQKARSAAEESDLDTDKDDEDRDDQQPRRRPAHKRARVIRSPTESDAEEEHPATPTRDPSEWTPASVLRLNGVIDSMDPKSRDEWKNGLVSGRLNLQCVAFSPYEARWVVAGGDEALIAVWQLKE